MSIRRPTTPAPGGAAARRRLARRRIAQSQPEVVAAQISAAATQVSARNAAIFALIAAIVGGILGAVPAYLASQNQIAAEDRRSTSEFLREQRQAAYAGMIAAHSELQSWISDNHDIDDVKSPEYYAAVDRFHNAFSHVLLVGSKEVRGEAEQMYRYVRHDLGGAYEDLDVPTTGRGITVRMVQEALRKEYNDFLEVARADISSGGN